VAVARDVADLVDTLMAILVATLVATLVLTLVATLQGEVPQLLLSSQAPGLTMEEEDPMEGPMEAHMEGAPMVHTLLGLLVLCVAEVYIGWLKHSPQILKQSLNIEQLLAFDTSIEQCVI